MKTKLLLFRTHNFKSLVLIALCIACGAPSLVLASDDLLAKLANHSNEAAEQCIKEVNKSAEDSLDTSARIYQTGLCYFCIDCDFTTDNGQLFQVNQVNLGSNEIIISDENYATAHNLITQAAGLGNAEANYGLAVLIYITDLINNKKSKIEISKAELALLKENAENSRDDTQILVEDMLRKLYQKTHKADFSRQIYKYLLFSAKQGYLPAQFALSEVYFKGIGVSPNDVQAYAWAATAVAQNPPFGSLRRDEKAVTLDNVKLNQAEAIAEEYMKKYTNIFDRSSVTVMR